MGERALLLTGATGFVGRAVRPMLEHQGFKLRCLTRDVQRARASAPGLDWIQGDLGEPSDCARALDGCEAALYLVHSMGQGGDFAARDARAAEHLLAAAEAAGTKRIVYLGGVAPAGPCSPHLQSRLDVGKTLRAGRPVTVELRASMIVGHGSLSWLVVRDLAARLPWMVLPKWLGSRTEPVAIDDVVVALVRALDLDLGASAWFDLPGPDVLSGREILQQTARVMGLPPARMLAVPFLTPRLSSLWVRFVTRADWSVAREIVVGLGQDLLAQDGRFWDLVHHSNRIRFAEAAARALAAEAAEQPPGGLWGTLEQARKSRASAPSIGTPSK